MSLINLTKRTLINSTFKSLSSSSSTSTTTTHNTLSSFSTSTRISSGTPHYEQPSGNLFGEKAVPVGQKRIREDWELIYYWGMFGGMALGGILIYYKPDTSLEGWARKEALARNEAAGETPTYKRS